jgi:hypothetical protein
LVKQIVDGVFFGCASTYRAAFAVIGVVVDRAPIELANWDWRVFEMSNYFCHRLTPRRRWTSTAILLSTHAAHSERNRGERKNERSEAIFLCLRDQQFIHKFCQRHFRRKFLDNGKHNSANALK